MAYDETIALDAVRRVRAGDTEAFAAVVDQLQAGIIRLAWTTTGDRDEALDAAQEVFLHLFRKLGRFHGRSSFRTWAYAVARNRLRTLAARAPRRAAELPAELPAGGPGQHEALERAEAAAALHAALARLDERQRTALSLYHFEDLDYAGIAAAMDAPLGTVKTWIFQGRRRLRAELSFLAPDAEVTA